eukprot:TRINITY_DN24865_c0_g1_i2.p1 TRINITY_DN24865_c0_g1~~TRINITY_DN24865_c0_g1_i2.p1  ORF type:complete len:1925 (-),score=199.93 TRINITY_DN24865_c0_g1_i2:65-5839(-)
MAMISRRREPALMMYTTFVVLAALQQQALASHGSWRPFHQGVCDYIASHNTCVVTSSRTISRPLVLRQSGNIRFTNGARWECTSGATAYENMRIEIAVTGVIALEDSALLHCATIILEANQVEISDTSEVSANGTSYFGADSLLNSGSGSSQPRGASYGGLGGTSSCRGQESDSEEARSNPKSSYIYGNPFLPTSFGKAVGRGLGGGRLRISAGLLALNGTLSASGTAPKEENDANDPAADSSLVAAGSGGSIWVSCRELVQPIAVTPPDQGPTTGEADIVRDLADAAVAREVAGTIVAVGGSCKNCLSGGGGRILVEVVDGLAPRHVIAAGGCWAGDAKKDGQECHCGSAGTWVLRRYPRYVPKRRASLPDLPFRGLPKPIAKLLGGFRSSERRGNQQLPDGTSTVLHVDNAHAVTLAGAAIRQQTPLELETYSTDMPLELHLLDANVVPVEESPTWTLTGLVLWTDQTGSTVEHFRGGPLTLLFVGRNAGVELSLSSALRAHELRVFNPARVALWRNSIIAADDATIIASKEIDLHLGELGSGDGKYEFRAPRIHLGTGRVRRAFILATEELRLSGRFRSPHRRCGQRPTPAADPCASLLSAEREPAENETVLANVTFDVALVARKAASVLIDDGAELQAAALLLCASQNVSVHGKLSARGLGCPPNRGESPGTAPTSNDAARTVNSPLKMGRLGSRCGGGGGAHCGDGGDGIRHKGRCPEGTGGRKYDGWWSSEAQDDPRPSAWPTWSASGGGGFTAGAGGGIVWLRAHHLELASNSTSSASVTASGDDGTAWADGGQEGGGGGAGGTIIINASSINGRGSIEASGGRGGGCLGGGGGGGVVGSGGPDAEVAWKDFQGQVLTDGGQSDRSPTCKDVGKPGRKGELLQFGVCPPGQAGIFCAACPPGTYNPPVDNNNATARERMCLPCKNKPPQSNYTAFGWMNESCPYACAAGFPPVEMNPNCDDAWTYYFAFFGGVWGVASGLLVTAVLFGISVSATHLKRLRRLNFLRKQRKAVGPFRGMDDEVLQLYESVRGRHPLSDLRLDFGGRSATAARPISGYAPSPIMSAARLLRRNRQRRLGLCKWFGNVFSRTPAADNPTSCHLFKSGDLPHHVMRIYLFGQNSPDDPWRFPSKVPEELVEVVDPARWHDFAKKLNSLCRKGQRRQRFAEGVLRWLYLPVGEWLRYRIRLSRAAEAAAFVWTQSESSRVDQTFWRLSAKNTGSYRLKFGADWNMALGFVDVLDLNKTLQDWTVRPRLPMVLAASGDGDYTAPYHLEYTDPFVQSVTQYLGRRLWNEVLLSFNLLARLLPQNPTEEDLEALRSSMSKVSSKVLRETDVECHAVLFESGSHSTEPARSRVPSGPPKLERKPSWERFVSFTTYPTDPGDERSPPCASPPECHTPMVTISSCLLQRRPALVLLPRAVPGMPQTRSTDMDLFRDNEVVPVGAGGLVSPFEAPESPLTPDLSYSGDPVEMSMIGDLDLGADVSRSSSLDIESRVSHTKLGPGMDYTHSGSSQASLHRRSRDKHGTSAREFKEFAAAPGAGYCKLSNHRSASSTPKTSRRQKASRLGRRCGTCMAMLRSTLEPCVRWAQDWLPMISRTSSQAALRGGEAAYQTATVPGNALYNLYLRRLQSVKFLSGVGRQAGLFLRHRKPRGNRATTLLCLLVALSASTLLFIAQSAVLFRLGPRHTWFWLSLLCPPFADILALVFGVLVVLGASDGYIACHFVVASLTNTSVGLAGRIANMETFFTVGLLYVLAEYLFALCTKVMICRMVNLLIAHMDAEPGTMEPACGEPDHEWVREQVLFRPHPMPERRISSETAPLRQCSSGRMASRQTSIAAARPPELSLMKGGPGCASTTSFCNIDSESDWSPGLPSRTFSSITRQRPTSRSDSSRLLNVRSAVSEGGWTPLLRERAPPPP